MLHDKTKMAPTARETKVSQDKGNQPTWMRFGCTLYF